MKLLVSDYDGTFHKKHSSVNTIRLNNYKINEWIKSGNLFMLSSGRSYESLMNKINEDQIPYSYLGTEDGSHLFDKDGNLLYEQNMVTTIKNDLGALFDLGLHHELQYGTTRAYLHDDPGTPLSSINLVLDPKVVTPEFTREWNRLKEKYTDNDFFIYGYGFVVYYCIKAKNIDKSTPIDKLSEIIGLDKKDIYTVGDAENDIPMIKHYNGVMIGNNPKVKKEAIDSYYEVYELVNDISKQKVKRR